MPDHSSRLKLITGLDTRHSRQGELTLVHLNPEVVDYLLERIERVRDWADSSPDLEYVEFSTPWPFAEVAELEEDAGEHIVDIEARMTEYLEYARDEPTLAAPDFFPFAEDRGVSSRLRAQTSGQGGSVCWDLGGPGDSELTFAVSRADLFVARAWYADEKALPDVLRELAQVAPARALDVIENGIEVWGQETRMVRGAVRPGDLTPILAAQDPHVRERAITLLGRTRSRSRT